MQCESTRSRLNHELLLITQNIAESWTKLTAILKTAGRKSMELQKP